MKLSELTEIKRLHLAWRLDHKRAADFLLRAPLPEAISAILRSQTFLCGTAALAFGAPRSTQKRLLTLN